jgi:hypothetical protein
VDAGYRTTAIDHGIRLGFDVYPVHRPPGTRGFTIIPRRWTIERSIGWFMHHRRLACDYETHLHRSEAMIHLAMIDLMARRLTGEATPNWRGICPGTKLKSTGQTQAVPSKVTWPKPSLSRDCE